MMKIIFESTISSLRAHDVGIKNLERKVEQCAQAIKSCLSRKNECMKEENVTTVTSEETKFVAAEETPRERATFSEKVKRRLVKEKLLLKDLGTLLVNVPLINLIKENSNETQFVQELIKKKGSLEEIASVKLNARCFAILRNELPPKEKDPGSFTLPCLIGKLEISNALADLGASISIMPYYMFPRLGV